VRETLFNGLLFGPGREVTVGGPGGINTPRSRTVTVIFQSSEPPRKSRNLRPLKSLLTVARTVGTSEQRTAGAKTAADLFPWGEG
jgi:hypothetical protein